METRNVVVETMYSVLGDNVREALNGKLLYLQETDEYKLEERGGVYGVAIKLKQSEVHQFFEIAKDERIKVTESQWKPLLVDGDYAFYPLYWGKDSNLGFRLFDHTKASKSTGTLQLNKREFLRDKDVYYGAVLCFNKEDCENKLRKEYPDILKNKIG